MHVPFLKMRNARITTLLTMMDCRILGGGGMVQPALWKRDIRMGQERLRGVQKRLQRLRSYAASSQNRYEVVVGLGEGQVYAILDKRKSQIWRAQCRGAVSECFGTLLKRHKRVRSGYICMGQDI